MSPTIAPEPRDRSNAAIAARDLVQLCADLGQRVAARTTAGEALAAVTSVAVERVPGAHHASITRGRGDRFQTLAPTDAVASGADRLQYELDNGPCVDSVRSAGPFLVGDLTTDERWPEFGPRAATEFGIGSMLSLRMVLDDDVAASLNLYGDDVSGLTTESETVAAVVSTHGALAVTNVIVRERAANLEKALVNSRRIGMAIGVLMATRKVTDEQAFAMMRVHSQNTNRRMPVIAEGIIETGTLDMPLQSDG